MSRVGQIVSSKNLLCRGQFLGPCFIELLVVIECCFCDAHVAGRHFLVFSCVMTKTQWNSSYRQFHDLSRTYTRLVATCNIFGVIFRRCVLWFHGFDS